MGIGAEIDVVYALTGPVPKGKVPSVVPLIEHLRSTKTISAYLRDALANLLDENGNSVWRLKLVRRDNRHVDDAETVERDVAAFKRARDLYQRA